MNDTQMNSAGYRYGQRAINAIGTKYGDHLTDNQFKIIFAKTINNMTNRLINSGNYTTRGIQQFRKGSLSAFANMLGVEFSAF